MFRSPKLRWLLFALLLATLPACLSVQSLNSSDPHVLHHHNWWNYYERGRLYLREKKFPNALGDFQTAIGLHPGARYPYKQDRWRARTYGMHMMEGYFPHRELGICLFELNRPQEALSFLETSLEMEPSARAKFYLNRVRRELSTATDSPRIELAGVPQWTNQRIQTLQGTVRGNNPVAELSINGLPEFIELAEKQIVFKRVLPLSEGSNRLSIVSANLNGQRAKTNLLIMADWQSPQISLRYVIPSASGHEISLFIQDNFHLARVHVNDHALAPGAKEYTFRGQLALDETLRVSAEDLAGNQIEWSLNDKELAELARQPQDAAPPRVILADADKTITLYNDEYALDIRAEDDVSLKNIQLNGIELLTEKSRIFRSLHRVPLSLGTNHFSIVAEDTVGKRTEKQIHVIRREPEYLDRHYRLATALPPISGELPDKLFGRRIELLMGEEITRDPARFYLLATDHEAEKILNEQALSSTELSDPRAALNRGGRLDSDLVFLNRVLSDGDGQTIYTQVVDAKSGDELFVEDVYLENRQQLEQQIGGLIMKLEQRFPLITALIVERGKLIAINAGTQNGVQNGTRFLIVRSDGAFEQGHVLQNKTRPAELIVSEIESASSRGIVTSETAEHSVRPGDYVFTR